MKSGSSGWFETSTSEAVAQREHPIEADRDSSEFAVARTMGSGRSSGLVLARLQGPEHLLPELRESFRPEPWVRSWAGPSCVFSG